MLPVFSCNSAALSEFDRERTRGAAAVEAMLGVSAGMAIKFGVVGVIDPACMMGGSCKSRREEAHRI
jgi:hypothetical protein